MATLQVRDIDDRLYRYLKTSAKLKNRSISQEVITIIQDHLNNSQNPASNATKEFLALSSAWKDDRSADVIVKGIRSHRINSTTRFGKKDGIFD
jgi:plasmid stability protein